VAMAEGGATFRARLSLARLEKRALSSELEMRKTGGEGREGLGGSVLRVPPAVWHSAIFGRRPGRASYF
jgi:hypothetical protein